MASGSRRPEVRGRRRIEPAPAHDGLRAPLLQRGVVQERIGPRVQHLVRERRRLVEVARHHADGPRLQALQQPRQAGQVHRLGEAVGDGLAHQRMIRHLALARQVLRARDLVGEDAADQVLGLHPCKRRRHLLAAAEARQRQRHRRHPAPARDEHRRVEHGLDQHLAHACRVEIARHLHQLEAVGGGERQHDAVLGGRRLQLEIELAAEALAQRQPPGPVDAAAVGRMHDELHAAGLVEEALQHDGLLRGQAAERALGRGEILDQLKGWPPRPSPAPATATAAPCPRPDRRPGARTARRAGPTRPPTARRCAPVPRPARTGWWAARRGRPPRAPRRAPRAGCGRRYCRAGTRRRRRSRWRSPR